MKGLRKVVWAEGVFLGQQHFQAWDQYQARVQALRTRMHEPYDWGLSKLVLDEAALLNGRLDLIACQGILPDGRVFDYRREHDGRLELDLTQYSDERLTIALVVPNSELVDNITGYNNTGRAAGWQAEYSDLEDVYDVGRVREVLLAKPNLRLQPADSVQENLLALNLVRLVHKHDAEYELDSNYLPPVVTLEAVPRLGQWVSNLIDVLQSRFRTLQEQRIKLGDLHNMTASEIADFLLQADITEALSELRTMESHTRQSPFELFKALLRHHDRIALHLMPERVPYAGPYRHEDLGGSFRALFDAFRELLGAERRRADSGITLKEAAPGRFESSSLSEAAMDRCTFFLAVRHDSEDPSWFTRFPNYFKVGAPSRIETMIASALPGLPLVHTQRVPQKVRIKSGYEYFMLDKNSDAWLDIRREGQFSAFSLGDFVSADVELLVIEE